MIEVKITCDDCGNSFAVSTEASSIYSDGTGSITDICISRIAVPPNWQNGCFNRYSRCGDCTEKWRKKMQPVWTTESEAQQAAVTVRWKRMFAEDRGALIEELRNIGPLNSSDAHRKIKALISCLES